MKLEQSWVLWFNRWQQKPGVRPFFRWVSRLGDWPFWVLLAAMLAALEWPRGAQAALHMVILGLVALAVYRLIKEKAARPRPFHRNAEISLGTHPLDHFSFPSGHTLHAVAFSIVATYYYPRLALIVWPFTILVAISRMVLGLHYPTDVAAGALLGMVLAGLSLLVVN
jgi:undecaprenyl-diphosphatase